MKQRTLARLALIPGTAWLLALYVSPFIVVLAVSFATTDILGQPVYGFHLDSYQQIFDDRFTTVFVRSIWYATAATALCLVLGYLTAYTISRYGGRYKNLLLVLFLVPWFVDYLIRIYSWIQVVGNGGVLASLLHALGIKSNVDLLGHSYTVIGGLTYSFLPMMTLAVYVSIDQLDGSLIEAGWDLYAGPVATMFRVTIPCTLPGILSGCMLVFLPAVGDFATAQLLGSPKQYMIGNIISNEVETPGALPIGAGFTTLLIGAMAVLALLLMAVSRPVRKRMGTINVLG